MRSVWIVCLLLQFLVAGVGAAAQPTLHFDEGIVVSDLSPGAQAVLLGAGRRLEGMAPVLVRAAEQVRAEVDGTAVWEPPYVLSERSVWAAVDVETGAFAVATPKGGKPEPVVLEDAVLRADERGEASLLDLPGRRYEVVVVRPGGGAWRRQIADGGDADADQTADGRVVLALGAMAPLASSGSEPPASFAASDVLVVIDAERLAVSALTVADAPLAVEVKR